MGDELFKLTSWNVAGRLGNTTQILQFLDSDVVALNEVYEGSLEMVANDLEMYFAFGPCHGCFGNGLLSKYPILEMKNYILDSKSQNEHTRALLKTTIQITDDITFTIFLTHLEHRLEKTRLKQLNEIEKIIESWKNSVSSKDQSLFFLVGDFNSLTKTDYTISQWNTIFNLRKEKGFTEETEEELVLVSQKLQEMEIKDAWKEVELSKQKNLKEEDLKYESFRTHSQFPIRIDYIFTSKFFPLPFISYQTLQTEISDHYPITVFISLQNMNNII